MDYKKIYNDLIVDAKCNPYNGYIEKHHIIPKSIGGPDIKENIVNFSARQHFVAHQLLVKIYPEHSKLIFAANMMCVDSNGNRITNRRYGWIKEKLSIEMSLSRKGKTKENDESVRRAAQKRSGENHPLYNQTKETNEFVRRLAELNSNRTLENGDEGRRSQSDKMKSNHWTSDKEHPGLIKLSITKTGKTKENDKGRRLSSEKQMKVPIELRVKIVELKLSGLHTKEIKDFLEQHNVSVSLPTIRRVYNRETKSKQKRGGQIKLIPELKEIIYNISKETKSYTDVHKRISSLGFNISYSTVKNFIKTYEKI